MFLKCSWKSKDQKASTTGLAMKIRNDKKPKLYV